MIYVEPLSRLGVYHCHGIYTGPTIVIMIQMRYAQNESQPNKFNEKGYQVTHFSTHNVHNHAPLLRLTLHKIIPHSNTKRSTPTVPFVYTQVKCASIFGVCIIKWTWTAFAVISYRFFWELLHAKKINSMFFHILSNILCWTPCRFGGCSRVLDTCEGGHLIQSPIYVRRTLTQHML